jgi:enterochelin esterase-like enzyme
MSHLSRRSVLRLGATAALFGVGLATATSSSAAPPPVDPVPPVKAVPTLMTGSFKSAARGGKDTNWIIARPPGQTGPLRTVIALHGKDSNAEEVMGFGVEAALAKVVQAGLPPFAVVAVDGGDGYWHPRLSGDDSGSMVLKELLPMLPRMGLDTSRVGFIGWSMGGYGALLLGGLLGAARTSAICAVSPALYATSTEAVASGAFDTWDDWNTYNVFGAPALSTIKLRIDCGQDDRFFPATRQFVTSLRRAPQGIAFNGGHDVVAWRAQLPTEMAWLAT